MHVCVFMCAVHTYVHMCSEYVLSEYVRTSKKRVRSCTQSRVAVVHIKSRVNIAYTPRTSIERCPLYTKNEEQPKLSAQYSNSRALGLLKRWVVVCVACLPWPVLAVSERSTGPGFMKATTALPSNTEQHSSHSVSYNTLCIMWFVAHRYSPHSCSISVLTSTSAVERSSPERVETW